MANDDQKAASDFSEEDSSNDKQGYKPARQ